MAQCGLLISDCLSARPLEPDPGYAGVGIGSSENVLFWNLAFSFFTLSHSLTGTQSS